MERRVRAMHRLAWMAMIGVVGIAAHAELLRLGPPAGVRAYTDIVYRHAAGRRALLDMYLPARATSRSGLPVVVAIHGGGWRGGTKNTYGREVARIARDGYAVVSVEYVLSAPGRPTWPENLEDVREAVRWVRRHATEYGIDPGRIAALGSSAGGHLAALLGTNARADDPESRVQAVVDLYGPSDLAGLFRNPGAVMPLRLLFGRDPKEGPALYRAASPIAHADSGSAPTLMIHGEADMLVPVAQSVAMVERLRASGVAARVIVVPGVGHAFGLDVDGRDLVPEIVEFLESAWPSRG